MNLLELPGGDLILEGFFNLKQVRTDTVSALLVLIALTRLRVASLDIPLEDLVLNGSPENVVALLHRVC
ncbi:MAG: hypothetical protein HC924_14230 [Synechococcaceae cyanobacterium SM2_3_2]|nr:hypothetical protein [Synechococcaceae cyanobacterium SM2_3_2]